MDYFITGNGSNLLVGDGGYRGVVFHICHTMDHIQYEEQGQNYWLRQGPGVMFSRLARQVSSIGYTGFEHATGIPGTLGGGVTMNAGAYGGEISDNLLWAELMDETGAILKLEKETSETFLSAQCDDGAAPGCSEGGLFLYKRGCYGDYRKGG